MEQFLISPLSAPVWQIMQTFGLTQKDPIWQKWWTKVKGDNKGDSSMRLAKYLQAMRFFNSISDSFWAQMSVNPTVFSLEGIVIKLTQLGDWLRAASLDAYNWSERFYLLAKAIAVDEPKGATIFKVLENAWPAQLKGYQIHYDNSPFAKVEFVQNEGNDTVVISPPLKMFKFNAAKIWADGGDEEDEKPMSSTVIASEETPTRRIVLQKKKKSPKLSFIPESFEPIDSDDDGLTPFATIGSANLMLE